MKGCSFHGYHLSRHLKIHVKKNVIREEDIPIYVQVATCGNEKRAPKRSDKKSNTPFTPN